MPQILVWPARKGTIYLVGTAPAAKMESPTALYAPQVLSALYVSMATIWPLPIPVLPAVLSPDVFPALMPLPALSAPMGTI